MRILMAHNYYQSPGGEDSGFHAESALLREHGHHVFEYVESNDQIDSISKLSTAKKLIWSTSTQHKLSNLIQKVKPEIVHFHNTFLMISPSAYYTCQQAGIPVVRTVQNYRHSCLNSFLFRKNTVCESCLGRTIPWPGIVHACYRDSHFQSLGVSSMLITHRLLQTWRKQVNCFITVTNFMRDKLIEGGLPADKIVVKPNFSDLRSSSSTSKSEYALFVGRFSEEKGIRTLLKAWQRLTHVPLLMLGDGPLIDEIRRFISTHQLTNIELVGWKPREEVVQHMQNASFLVQPSIWYEGFPMTIVESYGCSLPVIASRLGSMEEVVVDGKTGLHFSPSDHCDLSEKVSWAWKNRDIMNQMGQNALQAFQASYTPEQNYKQLYQIYEQVIRQYHD